jgi:hypothetical protein
MQTTVHDTPQAELTKTSRSPFHPAELLKPRERPGFGVPEAVALLAYCLLLAWCIPRHESWFDEAQAWLIARGSSLSDMLVHRLHYEGSPGLWHVLLWIETRLHVSFLGMHYIAGCIAALGVFVWLRFNPLPRVISLLLPFTFFLQYQYAVVARGYVLAPLFAFLLLSLYQDRKSSPWAFALAAGLFANCSLHMAAFSTGLVLLYALDRWRLWSADRAIGPYTTLRRLAAPALLLIVLFGGAAATAVPTADGSSTSANPIVEGIRKLLPHAKVAATQPIQKSEINLESDASTPPPQGPIATKVWYILHPPPGHSANGTNKAIKHLLVLLTAITVPVSTSNLLAACFLLLLLINLGREHLLLSLVPYALVQVCNLFISGEAHHIGLTWIALLCPLWLLSLRPVKAGSGSLLRTSLYAVTLLVVVLQIGWSAHAIHADIEGPYSSSQAAAAFIAQLPPGERIAAFDDDSVTVNAYLGRSPYFNHNVLYWPFSKTTNPSLFLDRTMAEKPDMVIVKAGAPDSPVMNQWVTLMPSGTQLFDKSLVNRLQSSGYTETHRFCGQRFFRNTSEFTDCRLVFELPKPN